ncbi:MAG: hypothetical protein ACYS8X_14330 [Planctomycetota bacterium]|jgi:hypothetical protein
MKRTRRNRWIIRIAGFVIACALGAIICCVILDWLVPGPCYYHQMGGPDEVPGPIFQFFFWQYPNRYHPTPSNGCTAVIVLFAAVAAEVAARLIARAKPAA